MAIVEDPAIFLEDHGVSVTAGATSGLGILDMPGEYVSGGMVISTGYRLLCEASKFGSIAYGSAMTVNGVSYTALEAPRLVDDGVFCEILLQKV